MSAFGVTLHAVGLYFLFISKSIAKNQKLFLTNLSLIEMIALVSVVISQLPDVYENEQLWLCNTAIQLGWIGITWFFIVVNLTVDRFLEVWLNIKYHVYITEEKIKWSLACCWVIGVISGSIIMYLFQTRKKEDIIEYLHVYIYPVPEALFIVLFCTVYVYLYTHIIKERNHRIKRQARFSRSSSTDNTSWSSIKAKHFIPFWIIITFIIFFLIPEITITIAFHTFKWRKHKHPLYAIMVFMFTVGYIVDPVIYIFLHKAVRTTIVNRSRRRKITDISTSTVVNFLSATNSFEQNPTDGGAFRLE